MFIKRFYQILMAPDGGSGDGGAGTGDDGKGGTSGGDGAGEGGTGDKGDKGDGASGDSGEKTFTQEQLEKIIADRLTRERKKYEGVDVEEYKKMKADANAKADSEKTELQKAQEKLDKAEKDKLSAIDTANKRLILAEFKVLAKDKDIKYTDDAFKLADLTTVKVNDEGAVEGLTEILDNLIKDKPFLLAEVSGGTGKVDTKSKDDKKKTNLSIGEQLAKAKKESLQSQTDSEKHYFK